MEKSLADYKNSINEFLFLTNRDGNIDDTCI